MKDKRQVLRSLRDRLRSRFNVAFAETDYQDIWQSARIELVSVNSSRHALDQLFQRLMGEIERAAGPDSIRDWSLEIADEL